MGRVSRQPSNRMRWLECLAAHEAVGRTGSITAAARDLGVNRNSVARYLAELDAAAPVPLRSLDRDDRPGSMTSAGEYLSRLLMPVFRRLETLETELRAGIAELRLGCQSSTSSYLLPAWMKAFQAECSRPDTERISLRTGSSEWLRQLLSDLEIDVAIVATDLGRRRSEAGIVITPLFRERLIAVCPKDHPLARGSVEAGEFVRHPQYLYYRGGTQYRERIEALAPGLTAERRMEFDTMSAIKETVRAGLGISIIPAGVIRPEDEAWIARVELRVEPERARHLVRAIALATRIDDRLPSGAEKFVRFMEGRARALSEAQGESSKPALEA